MGGFRESAAGAGTVLRYGRQERVAIRAEAPGEKLTEKE